MEIAITSLIIIYFIIMIFIYFKVNNDKSIESINIDKVSEMSLEEQLKLLNKEKLKMRELCNMYNRSGTVIRRKRMMIPNRKKQIEIEKMMDVVGNNISYLQDLIYGRSSENNKWYS